MAIESFHNNFDGTKSTLVSVIVQFDRASTRYGPTPGTVPVSPCSTAARRRSFSSLVAAAAGTVTMGIPGLLKQVGPLIKKENLFSIARGRRLGVDGHVWLHQLAYAFAQCIVVDKDYQPLARQFLQQALFAQSHGVSLVFVFDGAPTPAKRETDQARQVRRAKALAKLQLGLEPDANTLRAAVGLGWPAVEAVIGLLRQYGIPYIVAPYEADVQLALLCEESMVWGVTTVDSDFILHGMKNIFFKVNWRTGRCHLYSRELLERPDEWPRTAEVDSPLLNLVRLAGVEVLLLFGLIVGCDYGTKVPGIGGKKGALCLVELCDACGPDILTEAAEAVAPLSEILQDHAPGESPLPNQAVLLGLTCLPPPPPPFPAHLHCTILETSLSLPGPPPPPVSLSLSQSFPVCLFLSFCVCVSQALVPWLPYCSLP